MYMAKIDDSTYTKSCELPSIKDSLTTLFEDNVACIAQNKGGYIKGYKTKHISPKLLYTHELLKSGEIDVQKIRSSDNLAYLLMRLIKWSKLFQVLQVIHC